MTKKLTAKKKKPEKDGMQRILEAAVNEFCRAGLAGAKLDVIAMEANVSKQLIHHYYGTKPELYVAVINEITAKEISDLNKIDYENNTPEMAIQLFLEGIFGFFIHWPLLAGLYNDQSLYGGEHIPACRDLLKHSPELMKRLEEVIERGKQEGIFKHSVDPKKSIAAAIMVTLGGFTQGALIAPLVTTDFTSPQGLEDWLAFATDFTLNALKA